MVKKSRKSDKVETERRVNETIELILMGFSRFEIMEYARQKWGIARAQVDEYRRRATLILLKRSKASRAVKICKAEARYTRWLKKAETEKNIRLAAEMQDRLVQLGGLAAAQKLALTDTEGRDLTFLKIPDERENGKLPKPREKRIRLLRTAKDKNGN
jgi:hypothetical protein